MRRWAAIWTVIFLLSGNIGWGKAAYAGTMGGQGPMGGVDVSEARGAKITLEQAISSSSAFLRNLRISSPVTARVRDKGFSGTFSGAGNPIPAALVRGLTPKPVNSGEWTSGGPYLQEPSGTAFPG